VPVEGQWRRVHTPLGRRDRRVIAAVVVVALLAAGGGLGAYLSRPGGTSDAGCVVVTLASTMGGGTTRRCGADAVAFCRTEGPRNSTIAAACRRAGY
jgi:hypothetical protein